MNICSHQPTAALICENSEFMFVSRQALQTADLQFLSNSDLRDCNIQLDASSMLARFVGKISGTQARMKISSNQLQAFSSPFAYYLLINGAQVSREKQKL